MVSRRTFLKILLLLKGSLLGSPIIGGKRAALANKTGTIPPSSNKLSLTPNRGLSGDGLSRVYKVQGGSPEENIRALLRRLGGIDKLVHRKDIVVLKPNAQWWSQGMTNTDAMKTFMELVLNSEGFSGEIIIAENHQYNDYNGRGWSTDKPNGRLNYNDLVTDFNNNGYKNVTSYKWRGAGPNPAPIEGDDDGSGSKRVSGPEDGDGYVWRDDIVYQSPEGKKCWMTYPVFTSRYSGVTVDLMHGAWQHGNYLNDRKVRFINFSALNHHGFYCGVTASIKNLMGVVDMSCGFQAPTPEDTYNVHFIGIKKYIRQLPKLPNRFLSKFKRYMYQKAYTNFHFTGGALGKFMHDVRLPDLNIITAHWVGWGSRLDVKKSSYPKTLLASRDPVALDFVAAKDVLLPETPPGETRYVRLNDPDRTDGALYRFLRECHEQGIGNLSEDKIRKIELTI